MTDADYLRALFPDNYGVAGVWLKPYCLGHVFLLERISSPFVGFEREISLGDLRLALAICKRTYPDALVYVRRASKWNMPLRICTRERFEKGVSQFIDYVQKSSTHPTCWNGLGRKIGSPFLQSIKLTLIARLGKTELEAMSCPLALALWDYMAYWEMEDRMQIVSDEQKQAMAFAKSLSEKRN